MYRKKREIKEQQEKEERKRKREEKVNSKCDDRKNIKKPKRKIFKKEKENLKNCFVCLEKIKRDELQCDECKNYFHKLCVPKKHKELIMFDEDEDEIYLCHHCYKEDDSES